MRIILYTNKSDNNKVIKDLEELRTVSGFVREGTSLIDPEIDFRLPIGSMLDANYLYIEDFNRYYFINEITTLTTDIFRVRCHIDVLQTYAEQIKAQKAIIKKSESKWNLYLNDGTFKIYQNPDILTKPFPTGFSAFEFVLAVAGRTSS